MTAQAARLRYIIAEDNRSQIVAPLTDALDAKLWSLRSMSWSNRQYPDLPVVECADPIAWLDAQLAARSARIDARRQTVVQASLYLSSAAA